MFENPELMMLERYPLGGDGAESQRQAFIVSGVYNVNLLWALSSQGHPLSCQPMAPALYSAFCPHYPGPVRGPQWVGDTAGILRPG